MLVHRSRRTVDARVSVALVTRIPACFPKETGGSPEFPDYPSKRLPRSQTPVVSRPLALARTGLLPSRRCTRPALGSVARTYPLSTTIHFSGFNDAACALASTLLRTSPLSDRSSVRLSTWWLTFGRVGLVGFHQPTHWVMLTSFKGCHRRSQRHHHLWLQRCRPRDIGYLRRSSVVSLVRAARGNGWQRQHFRRELTRKKSKRKRQGGGNLTAPAPWPSGFTGARSTPDSFGARCARPELSFFVGLTDNHITHLVNEIGTLLPSGFSFPSKSRNSALPIPPSTRFKTFPCESVMIVVGVATTR